MIEEQVRTVKEELIQYATLVEKMIDKSIKGITERNAAICKEVIETDEQRANHLELRMDAICTNLIVRYDPKAGDLRLALMAMKIGSDFERMADHAVNIAESGVFLVAQPEVKPLVDIPRITGIVMEMVRDTTSAFLERNAERARKTCGRDNEVDTLRHQVITELIVCMTKDPAVISRALHLLRVVDNLERIADLTTNISEDIVYLVTGEIIKHHCGEMQEESDENNGVSAVDAY